LTSQAVDLTDATFKFFSPLKRLKFPIEELSLITMISLRFVPLLLEEAFNLKKAQMSRGASFEGGLIKRVKKTLPLLVPLFVSSFRKADELALALDARGFRSGQERTSFQRLVFKRSDYLFLSFVLVIIVISCLVKKI
jgi:energy-coupling factor transport system permease protein